MSKNKLRDSKRVGFTLAEVLIVLGVIGIVAQMTIPVLSQQIQDQTSITQLKKVYSTFFNAYNQSIQENGTPDQWGLGTNSGFVDPESSKIILNIIGPYMKIDKNCGKEPGCFPDVTTRWLNGSAWMNFNQTQALAKAQLADGTLIWAYNYGACYPNTPIPNVTNCGCLAVDINGFTPPNQIGVDEFEFNLTTKGIIPGGTQQDAGNPFSDGCRDKTTATGEACAAWVIFNGNRDYLKCNDLDWNTKTKCS